MNPNNQTIPDDEIDLREIILTLWKEKYLILIITLVFTVAGYIYGTLQPKVYQTTITLRDAPEAVFERYKPFLLQQQQPLQREKRDEKILLSKNFNQEFKLNLQSLSNMVKFVEQNEELNEFKSYIKKSDVNLDGYFKDKGRIIKLKKDDISYKYTLTFSKPLPGPQFLNDYITFVLRITNDFIKNEQTDNIIYKIKTLKLNIEIAKNQLGSLSGQLDSAKENYIFYIRQINNLSQQLIILESMLSEMKDFSINYNPVVEKAIGITQISKSNLFFMAVGFAISLIFYLLIFLMRKIVTE